MITKNKQRSLKTRQLRQLRQLQERKKRARRIAKELRNMFPEVTTALHYHTRWEFLVAVMLSAQCTDKKVNEVTEKLFTKYRTLHDYIAADRKEFEHDIRQTGFYKNKAKNILTAAKIVKKDFHGIVPKTMEELLTIPGVARKTANVVLAELYGVTEGIAVDTHVKRFAQKFELSDSKNPIQIERDFMKLFPKREWSTLTLRFIEYGREICPARKHDCAAHPLTRIYPKAADIWPTSK